MHTDPSSASHSEKPPYAGLGMRVSGGVSLSTHESTLHSFHIDRLLLLGMMRENLQLGFS